MANDIETRDKVILDAIERLRVDFDKRFDAIDAKNERMSEKINNLSESFLREISEVNFPSQKPNCY